MPFATILKPQQILISTPVNDVCRTIEKTYWNSIWLSDWHSKGKHRIDFDYHKLPKEVDQMSTHKSITRFGFISLVVFCMTTGYAVGQAGHMLNGVGPIDQSWSGAGMAIPQDAISALHWNPASITTISGNELDVSLQLMKPTGTLKSFVRQGAFGPTFGPPQDVEGETASDAGIFPIPSVAYVARQAASRWAFGISAFGIGGFGVDYLAGASNPIATPQPPLGMGFGHISSEFAMFQAAPTIAYQVNNSVSFGIAPSLNVAMLTVGPFPAATPNDANGDGFPSYPDAPRDAAYGFGVQAGVLVQSELGWNVAVSFKSRQYFSDFEFDCEDELGVVGVEKFRMDYPMILSGGLGYSIDKFTLAADLRYIDFSHTPGFDVSGFSQTGAVLGFGWDTIMLGAIGLQYEVADGIPVRIGYSYNENPISDEMTFYNVSSPAIIQHHFSAGFSVDINNTVTASVAAQYGLQNSIEGPWYNPAFGAVSGTTVTSELSTFTAIFGVKAKL